MACVSTRSISKGVVLIYVFCDDICNCVSIPTRHAKVAGKRAVASLAAK